MNAFFNNSQSVKSSDNHKGDFLSLLKQANYPLTIDVPSETSQHGADIEIAHSTTVVAVRYQDGVMIAGDRRATAGTSVIYDRAEKVLQIDRHSVARYFRFTRNRL